MHTETFYFKNADNIDIHTYCWLPENNITRLGVLQIAHGMAEHAKRYQDFANFLTQNGFIVYANDHRGHGKTIKQENDMGFFALRNGWFKVVEDMKKLTHIIKEKHPELPVFIMGHSMGSLLTRTYICNPDIKPKAVVLSGTAGSPGMIRYLAKFIVLLFKNFKGKRARVKLLDKMTFGEFNKKIKNPKTTFDWLNTDETEVQKYINDPLCGQLFTVQFFDDLLNGLGYIFNKKNITNITKDLPLLIISGKEDPVGDFGKGPQKSFKIYKKAGINNISMKLYTDMRHEIINEINKEIVYNDILNFLKTCI